jgi:hypothetical protein
MWNSMSKNPELSVNSSVEGLNKVKNGGYAYILGKTKINRDFKF